MLRDMMIVEGTNLRRPRRHPGSGGKHVERYSGALGRVGADAFMPVFSVRCSVFGARCSVFSVQWSVLSAECEVCSVLHLWRCERPMYSNGTRGAAAFRHSSESHFTDAHLRYHTPH